jgi:hypothetical protein
MLGLLVLGALSVGIFAGVSRITVNKSTAEGMSGTGRLSHSTGVPDAGHVTDLITLSTTRSVAGTDIEATFIVNNPGGPISLTDSHGCQPAFGITLTTDSFATPCIGVPLRIKHGVNRFPGKVITTYEGCLQPNGRSSVYVPACVDGKPPPLTPGIYHASLVSIGLSLPTPRPVTVILTR